MPDPQLLTDIITATRQRTLTWSDDPDPVTTWYGRTLFAGPRSVYIGLRGRWEAIGPSAELRRIIEEAR